MLGTVCLHLASVHCQLPQGWVGHSLLFRVWFQLFALTKLRTVVTKTLIIISTYCKCISENSAESHSLYFEKAFTFTPTASTYLMFYPQLAAIVDVFTGIPLKSKTQAD